MIRGESQQTFASPEEALAHYGVKGMKWGVRRRDRGFAKAKQLRDEAHKIEEGSVGKRPRRMKRDLDKAYNKKVEATELERAVSTDIRNKATKASQKEFAELRKRPEFQNINYRDDRNHPQFDSKKFQELEKAESKIWMRHLNDAVSDYKFADVKVSKSGRTWDLVPREIKHAIDTFVVVVQPIRDQSGNIIRVDLDGVVENDDVVEHRVKLGGDFLERYGVGGMR